MVRRKSPYLTKTNAKNREISNTSGVTDYTSQDIFYTTESNDTRTSYAYTDKYRDYKDYFTSDVYENYSPKRKGSGESNTYDDYTTSGISYDRRKKNPNDLIFAVSTSDHVYGSPEKYNNSSYFRDYDRSYPREQRSREKKRLKVSKNSDKSNYYDILDESEQYVDRNRYRSPRSRYYHGLIHEEPEKEFEYDKYFEKAGRNFESSTKQRRHDKRYDDERYGRHKKLQSRAPNKHKEYQVYAYQEPKNHENVFKAKNHPGDLSLSSEVEIKTHEYPVLAFRDESGNKESDRVYLPIIVLDKKSGKSRPEKSTEEPIYQGNHGNFQVFAANLEEQQNIFQHFGDLPNKTTSREPTSTEKRQTQDFWTEPKSGMRYADSLLGTIIDEAVDTDFRNEDLRDDTETGQRTPFAAGKSPFTYQVDVDIAPNEATASLKDSNKQSSLVKNSSFNDPLHDGYPVTKDYIKVSSVSEQKRKNSLAPEHQLGSTVDPKMSEEKKLKTIKEETQSFSNVRLIDDETISMGIAQSKVSLAKKPIIRNPLQQSLDKQPLDMEFSSTRQSVATGTKQNSRASRVGPAERAETRGRSAGLETRHLSHGSDRKSMKPDMQSDQTVDRRSKVQTSSWTPPSPVFDNRMSVLQNQPEKDRKSTVVHMAATPTLSTQDMRASHVPPSLASGYRKSVSPSQPSQDRRSVAAQMAAKPTPSSQNTRASHAQSRKSAVDRLSKVYTPPSLEPDHRKSVLHSRQSQDRKGTVAQTHPLELQNTRESHAQSRKSAVTPRMSAASLFRGGDRKSMKASAREGSQKTVPESGGEKSLKPTSAHPNTDKLSHPVNVEDDSSEALREFTKDVFNLDLRSQDKTPSRKSEQKKPSVSKERLSAPAVRPNYEAESKRTSRKSAVGQQTLNLPRQSQNVGGNAEPTHEQIGDSSAGNERRSVVEDSKNKPLSLRTTSKIFRSLSKIGKKKSTDQVNPEIQTGGPTGSHKSEGRAKPATQSQGNEGFVRSIEPTVAQYKKDQNKTQTLTKSKSKPDTKVPKEKGSFTRLFSKSKSSNESGDDKKKTKRKMSKTMSGILRRSKASEKQDTEPAEEVKDSAAECDCLNQYMQNTRMCAYFFLGTTLHEQIMNIIKILLSGS